MAHCFERHNSVGLVTKTIKLAKRKEKITKGLILHSDQGYQYTSDPYHLLVTEYGLSPSMSRHGNCWDNAPMKNFFGHLKEEALQRFKNPTFQEVKQIIDDYIYFFNYERIQLKTKQTPYQVRCLSDWTTGGLFCFVSSLQGAVQTRGCFYYLFLKYPWVISE